MRSKAIQSSIRCKYCKGTGEILVFYRDCAECGKTFKTFRKHKIFCSRLCQTKHQNKKNGRKRREETK